LRLDHRQDLFDEAAATAVLDRLVRVLDRFVTDPDGPVARIDLLTDVERDRGLHHWNDTAVEHPPTTLPEAFARRAAATPEAPALVFGKTTLTFAELDMRANRLAHRLLSRGVGAEDNVALPLPRAAGEIRSAPG